jgi:hypothetical protein
MHKLLVVTLMLFVFCLGAMAQEKSAQPKEKSKTTQTEMKHTNKAATPTANEGVAEQHKASTKHQNEGKHEAATEDAKQAHKQPDAAHKPSKTEAQHSEKTKEQGKK